MADSRGARARTTRPTAWAKNSGVRYAVIHARHAARGMSTPSEIIRTQTAIRWSGRPELLDPLRRRRVVGQDQRRLPGR